MATPTEEGGCPISLNLRGGNWRGRLLGQRRRGRDRSMDGAGVRLSQPAPAVEAAQSAGSYETRGEVKTQPGGRRRAGSLLHRSCLRAAAGRPEHALGVVDDLLGDRAQLDQADGVLGHSEAADS